ncbi:MAG: hypothetical protein ABSD70_09760 [Terracidiphilus sp.]
MRPDRPVIGGVVCLATGVALLVAYCHDASSANIAYPFSSSALHVNLTTTGPAVLGGLAFLALGILFLAWSLLVAIGSQISLLFHRDDRPEGIFGRYDAPSFEAYEDQSHIRLADSKKEG